MARNFRTNGKFVSKQQIEQKRRRKEKRHEKQIKKLIKNAEKREMMENLEVTQPIQ